MNEILFLHPGHLRDTFEPIYPKRLWIEAKTFCTAFPFHVVFDESMRGTCLSWTGDRLGRGVSLIVLQCGGEFQVPKEYPEFGRLGFSLAGLLPSFSLWHLPETRMQHLLDGWGREQFQGVWTSGCMNKLAIRENRRDTEVTPARDKSPQQWQGGILNVTTPHLCSHHGCLSSTRLVFLHLERAERPVSTVLWEGWWIVTV